MVIAMCSRCMKPVPDSFHDFKEYCSCRTKEGWIQYYKKMKWMLKIEEKCYDFTND